jgi:Chaperone of endosialidase
LFSTQYFGSPHTGNVFQSHGLELSVPNANNSAIVAGYDVNWNAGYINVADQSGFSSLGLNTTGGFIGIGKITPVATLDISGNAIISGGLTIGGSTNFSSNVSFNTMSITSTTNSTSTTTGALILSGGAGIGGNVNIGGFSTHVFDASFNGNIQLTQTNNPLWLVSKNTSTINGTLASGNDVGIFYGTTNPASAGLVISPRGAGGGIKMSISGNVGINTNTPRFTFDVAGIMGIENNANNKKLVLYDNNIAENATSATNFYGFGINNGMLRYQVDSTNSTHAFFGGSTEYMRIVNSNVGIGTTNPLYRLDIPSYITRTGSLICDTLGGNGDQYGQIRIVNGSSAFLIRNDSNATYFMYTSGTSPYTDTYDSNYTVFSKSNGRFEAMSFNARSDYRLKTNVVPLCDLSYNIDNLNPIKYTFSTTCEEHMGFFAHEVQEQIPFLVAGEKDGESMQSINYNGFIALLVKEVQDLKKENRELKERMDRLEQRFM